MHRTLVSPRLGALRALVAAGLLLAAGPTLAALPGTLQVEGVLNSAGGPVVDGPYKLTFAFWNAASAGEKLGSESIDVAVAGGRFAALLGAASGLDGKIFAGGKVFVGVAVGNDPELPRQPLSASAFAFRAGVAEAIECSGCLSAATAGFAYAGAATKGGPALDLACSGCVGMAELKFDGDLDLGGNSLKAKNATLTGDVVAKTVTATAFVGDGSKLTGISQPNGACKDGEALVGIAADGALQCKALKAALPSDGLDEVSNGLLTNQFIESLAIAKPLPIPDNTGATAVAVLKLPAWGVAQGLKISVQVDTTDLSSIAIKLLPPNDKKVGYTLCDPCGDKDSKALDAAWSHTKAPLVGDLSAWLGASVAGDWTLVVTDSAFCVKQSPGNDALCDLNAKTDGALKAFAIEVHTLSDGKVAAAGTFIAKGGVDFASSGTKGLRIEAAASAPVVCDAKTLGYLYLDTSKQVLMICDGQSFKPVSQLKPGSSAGSAGESCAALLAGDANMPSGDYWIDPLKKGAYLATCEMKAQGGGWTLLAKDAKRHGTSVETIAAVASGAFKQLRAVHKSGFVACNCSSANPNAPWQACNPSHGDVYSFELMNNGGYILKQDNWSVLPGQCAKPASATADILCTTNFTVQLGDKLAATWQEPSNNVSTSDNCGTQVIDLWAR